MSAKTKRVGVAWKRTTQDGKPFLSVSITNPLGADYRFTIWPAENRQSENSPDYVVTAPADERPATARTTTAASGEAFPTDTPSNDDIPF
jgi:uncharacterized protein (DUF736 family)